MKPSEFTELKNTISGMPREKAIDHIWTYYKGRIILTLLIVLIIAFVVVF